MCISYQEHYKGETRTYVCSTDSCTCEREADLRFRIRMFHSRHVYNTIWCQWRHDSVKRHVCIENDWARYWLHHSGIALLRCSVWLCRTFVFPHKPPFIVYLYSDLWLYSCRSVKMPFTFCGTPAATAAARCHCMLTQMCERRAIESVCVSVLWNIRCIINAW